jgi:4-hydroxy-3-methylbut-2-enyl diphosphate reductase
MKRQEATKEFAKQLDILIVVGDKSSSNTKNLKELGEKHTKAEHIENADDLHKDWFDDKYLIGIASGTSTPNSIIDEVETRIGSYIKERRGIFFPVPD